MNKRGQFYLIATIIIVGVVGGLLVVTNYSQKKVGNDFSYLKDELNIESQKVIDYGLLNNQNLDNLLKDFTKNYSNYSHAENSYFVFGNQNSITLAGYKRLSSGNVKIDFGQGEEILNLDKGIYNSKDFSSPNDNIKLIIDGIDYDFALNKGENFYFVLVKEFGEERHVIAD